MGHHSGTPELIRLPEERADGGLIIRLSRKMVGRNWIPWACAGSPEDSGLHFCRRAP